MSTVPGIRYLCDGQVRDPRAMNLLTWLRDRGGIGHRDDASDAGFTVSRVRAAIRSGAVLRIRSNWIALASAPDDLITAATSGGVLTCVSLARRRGWWVPPDADGRRRRIGRRGLVRPRWSRRPRWMRISLMRWGISRTPCMSLIGWRGRVR